MKNFRGVSWAGLATFVIAVAGSAVFVSCASLESMVRPLPPEASLRDLRLTDLNFTTAGLVADVEITNPNTFAVTLERFSYVLSVEEQMFLSGENPERVSIAAGGQENVTLPFEIALSEALRVAQAGIEANELGYTVQVNFVFDVPLLGEVRLPVEQSGTMPVPRPPRPELRSVRLDSIGLRAAELTMTVAVENPNIFGFVIESLQYDLLIQGRSWARGRMTEGTRLPAGKTAEIDISFGLSFLEVGAGVYQLLRGAGQLDYRLEGLSSVRPDHPLIPPAEFPLSQGGTVPLRK
ncbi:MAG: LEA type 2 family protein [Spirochaetia bacterium]